MANNSTGERPATILQVALLAGVSRATVSRVLNGYPTVHPDIVNQVRGAIEELSFNPSATARNLSLGRTQTIGVFVPDLENPMFLSVLRGVARAAAADGYRILVADSEERVGEEIDIIRETRRRCDAVVLCAPRTDEAELENLLRQVSPVVVVNRSLTADSVSTVQIDYTAAAKDVAAHLVDLGHRRVAYLGGPATSASDRLRRLGFEAFDDRMELVLLPRGSSMDDGYGSAEAVLGARVTAAICYNDLIAVGLLARLRELKVDVPGALSVVGFDDIPFARFTEPTLTTTSVPRLELGMQAWRRLKEQIDGNTGATSLQLRADLVVRQSTGRPA